MVAANNFNIMGIVLQSNGDTVVTNTSTYPADVMFRGLVSNTSYRYTLRVVSKDDSSIAIGSFSGNFTTSGPGELGWADTFSLAGDPLSVTIHLEGYTCIL